VSQTERNLFLALRSLSFTHSGVLHFGACGARTVDHCTTPTKCELCRQAWKSAMDSEGGQVE
jgi:hypothetical protein